jgi:hypothetical protein
MSIADWDSETMPVASALDAPADVPAEPREGEPKLPEHQLVPRPDLAGKRLVCPGQPDIYLIDPKGFRRLIPCHSTYCRLFRDWRGIIDDRALFDIAAGPQLARGTLLIQGDASEQLYLLDDARKRPITSREIIDKYWFNWDRLSLVRQILVDILPTGDIWE